MCVCKVASKFHSLCRCTYVDITSITYTHCTVPHGSADFVGICWEFNGDFKFKASDKKTTFVAAERQQPLATKYLAAAATACAHAAYAQHG